MDMGRYEQGARKVGREEAITQKQWGRFENRMHEIDFSKNMMKLGDTYGYIN
jgi:hypothetical protein